MQTMSPPILEPFDTLRNMGANMAVAVYSTHPQAEIAIRALGQSGFDMTKLSIVGRDYHTEERVTGYYTNGERMMSWGKAGAFWGGIWGLLFGSALFIIPGVGPVVMAGPIIGWIVGALEGAALVGGLSVLGAALVGMGIPHKSALAYETEITAGKFLLLVYGTPKDITEAKALLSLTNHEGLHENVA